MTFSDREASAYSLGVVEGVLSQIEGDESPSAKVIRNAMQAYRYTLVVEMKGAATKAEAKANV